MHIFRNDTDARSRVRSAGTGAVRAGTRVGLTALLTSCVAVGALELADASPASASTLNGIATIASPGGAPPLTSGASKAPFTVVLPAQAACDGDTATHGYHVYSYLVHKGTTLSTVTFVAFPSVGFGLVDNTGTYYGPVNTAIGTGQIVGIPNNFEWGPLVSGGGVTKAQLLYTGTGTTASGIWEAGLACANSSGALADNWNTEITFNAKASDPNGFTWTVAAGTVGIHVVTTSLSPGTAKIATPYKSAALTATGGKTPYKWKVTTGKLPAGLKLGATTGIVSGTVKAGTKTGAYPFTVTVTDSTAGTKLTATANLTLTVTP